MAQQDVAIPRTRAEDAAAERFLDVAVEQQDGDGRQVDNGGRGKFPWLTVLGFGFLTFNSATAIIRSNGDRMAMLFVGFTYADLVALFVSLRMYESARAGSSKRDWLKIAVWIQTTLLTLAFSGKVAAVMPLPVAVAVWVMAFATIVGGFFAFFIFKEKK